MKKLTILTLFVLFLFSGCSRELLETEVQQNKEPQVDNPSISILDSDGVEKGILHIKVDESLGEKLFFVYGLDPSKSSTILNKSKLTLSGIDRLDKVLRTNGIKHIEPAFILNKKYEKRQKRAGLHLWYDVYFNDDVLVSKIYQNLSKAPDILYIEPEYKKQIVGYNYFTNLFINSFFYPSASTDHKVSQNKKFNDPRLSQQWHYFNNGSISKSIKRADINLFEAWEKTVGKSEVLVAVVDGGIDYRHEDLQGAVDTLKSHNFVDDNSIIIPHPHGTHVAGTIAARNNNNIGVCGIAGGDGTSGSGVKLISCQVFEDRKSGGFEKAIVYGADNGALISQNSWGYNKEARITKIPKILSLAVDYFIQNAGCDNDGNQLPGSLMKGGVVIFAAGNDNLNHDPVGEYPPIIAVSAYGPDLKKATYSNFGQWIDICAPGGDTDVFGHKGAVLSTTPNNHYEFFDGTSMACPHVSGIAALIVSHEGKNGFTSNQLRKRLLAGLRPFDIYKINNRYLKKLGAGYIDAARALDQEGVKAPGLPNEIRVSEVGYDNIKLEWNAALDEDPDDVTASTYQIYYDEKDLNRTDLSKIKVLEVSDPSRIKGQKLSCELTNLPINKTYHIALKTKDRWGNKTGKLSKVKSVETKKVLKPEIKLKESDAKFKIDLNSDDKIIGVKISDPQEFEWNYKISGNEKGIRVKRSKDGVTIKFIPGLLPVGKNKTVLTVSNKYNLENSQEIDYDVYKNSLPEIMKKFSSIILAEKQQLSLDLNEYFSDPENDQLKYSIDGLDKSLLDVKINGAKLIITPIRQGEFKLTIKATDPFNGVAEQNLFGMVGKSTPISLIFPNPVRKVLNVKINDNIKGSFRLYVLDLFGTPIFEKKYISSVDPIAIKLDKIIAGSYTLILETKGEFYSENFIKL